MLAWGSDMDSPTTFDVFGLHPRSFDAAVRAGGWVYDRYFRVDSAGSEHVPAKGAAIVVANHGGVLPVDAAMLCVDLRRRTSRIPRAIADHFVPRIPVASTLFARFGMVNGTRANVQHLLAHDELVVIFPEGVTGPAKRFRERYRLQHWRVGFAELAIRNRVPVIPVAILGAEESWPLAAKFKRVHAFGAPYWPIPVAPLPLPAHYHLRYGAPLHLGTCAADADDPALVAAAAAETRVALQQLIDDARAERRGIFK